ncbi:YchF/TatD family DNA exonuclease [Geomonas subterranea]|uniref:YchF/TatD family DNA exonuclease n=1 Tax=Geomonas subterranea TaxID=2847989 RepID=A0ABX8LRD0_9BACT|nr:TatD family hydrolase [Geomonas subterranea]QXE92070.1 YchF/TatD family DNA exonuclease [Geomonas subterranea]QXM09837.1 YchF/TatD family DNA exonuclease [Geomonas subterranea]
MELIDSHSHIYGHEYAEDFEEMMARASEAGVGTIMAVGADMESSREAVALAAARPNIYCAVGIHPHDAAGVTEEDYQAVRELALGNPKVVAIGEVGLDFFRDRSPRPAQEEVFRRFIRMARELSLPLIIHDRDAHDRILAILKEEKAHEVGGVLHCFSGDLAMAQECIAMNFMISIPGTVTYPSNEALREVVRGVKIERLMVETDAPYLTPVPHRGKRNEPAFVRFAAERIAELKGLSPDDVGRITSFNTRRLFRIDQPAQEDTIAYKIRESLYLNITNRCSNRCTFCPKFEELSVKGHELKLSHEPDFAEVIAAVDAASDYNEVVFCGFGEPLIRLDLVKEVAAELKRRGLRVRINTDGQANLVHGRNILPELSGLVDSLSVSLNAANAADYDRLCNTPFGAAGFAGLCDFLREAPRYVPQVTASAVTVPGLDVDQVRKLALSLGVEFREREYSEVG